MTFNDLLVIVVGSVALLVIFLIVQAVYVARTVDLWAVVRRYVAVHVVNDYEEAAPDDMSSDGDDSAPSAASSLRTDDRTDGRTEAPPRIRADELLTVYQLMRAYGIKRDEAAAAFKASGLPLSNDVWRRAEPPPKAAQDDDDVMITPWAGRRTRASYYPEEPELEYKSPA